MTKSAFSSVGQALATLTTEATKASVARVSTGTEAICMCLSGATGPMMGAAFFSSKMAGNNRMATDDKQFLFICLLMAEVCQVDTAGTGAAINFNPTALATAAENYEKLTGRSPREFLHEGLLAILDEELELSEEDRSKFSQFLPN